MLFFFLLIGEKTLFLVGQDLLVKLSQDSVESTISKFCMRMEPTGIFKK